MRWYLYNNKGQLIKTWPVNQKEPSMKVSDFALEVCEREGKKKSLSIAQVKEVLRIINDMTNGDFYKQIRKIAYIRG